MPRRSSLRTCEVDVPALTHPCGFVHRALREEVTSGRFGGRLVGGSPGPLATACALLERTGVR